MNKSESKYFNTAVKMDKALLKLLESKPFEYITVREICQTAQVNRSTFYLHYQNTRELLEESLRHMDREFLTYFKGHADDPSQHSDSLISPRYLTPYLTYIKEHQTLFRAAMQHTTALESEQRYQSLFEHIFVPDMERFHVPAASQKYMVSFFIYGIIGIVREWLKTDCADPIEQIVAVIMQCTYHQTEQTAL